MTNCFLINIFLEKSIFSEPQFNLTQEFCSEIEAHRNTTEYDAVEAEVVSFNAIKSWTEHLVPILLSFYIGSWSDHFGRKPFLALCMFGKLVGAVFNLLNGIFLDEWNRWVWLGTVMPIQNISGGYLTFIMMTYSFIADNSTPRYFFSSKKLKNFKDTRMLNVTNS